MQGFQGRRAELRVTAQQAAEQLLVQREASRQTVSGGGSGQGFGAAQIDDADPQVEVTRAIAHLVAQLEGTVGQRHDAAIGVQPGPATACAAVAGADVNPAADPIWRRRTDYIEQPVGHRQHVGNPIDKPVTCVVTGLAAPQGVDRSTLLHHDRAGAAHQKNFRGRQCCPFAQRHRAVGTIRAGCQVDKVPGLAVLHHCHAAHHQPRCAQGIEGVGLESDAGEVRSGGLARADHFDTLPGRVQH